VACAKLVDAFLPAIGGVARFYRGFPTVGRDELVQEGVVGLLRAANRYEPKMGTPFWAYASWWVRQAMQQLVAEVTGPVVLSDRAARGLARIKQARREHEQAHGAEPSIEDLVEETDLTREQIGSLTATERAPRGLEESFDDEDGSSGRFGDRLADPVSEDEYEHVVERVRSEEVPSLTRALDARERGIVHSHYGIGAPSQTLREIAGGLDLSVERVRQIEEGAMNKMRDSIGWPDIPR
jgi:RNA polymerase sigma factor (sigma-70 family)